MPANANIWLHLRNQRQVVAGLAGARQGIGALQTQVGQFNQVQKEAHHRSFLMNQALFTMRRFAYGATLGVGALTAASARLGFQFNTNLETNTVAMTHFLGSEAAARRELEFLYELAAKTPFEFSNLTAASRRFLAFGFDLEQTREMLQIVGDTASGLGGDAAENIERLVLVLGQVKATGRVLGQDMLQLQQIGINTNKIFREELGITQEQLKQGIGALQIPADVALPAIMRGLQKQFEGMAEEQSKTMAGLLSTAHDYTAQLLGTLTLPIWTRIRDEILPGIIDMTQELQVAAKAGANTSALIGIIDQHIGAMGALNNVWRIFSGVFEIIGNIMTEIVLPAFRMAAIFTYPLFFGVGQVIQSFAFLTEHSDLLRFVLGFLIIQFAYLRAVMAIQWLWNLRLAVAWGIHFFWANKNAFALRVLWAQMLRLVVATKAYFFATTMARSSLGTFTGVMWLHNGALAVAGRATWGWVVATNAQIAALLRLRIAIFGIPIIGWILAIIAGIIALEMKFHGIERGVRRIWGLFIRFKNWVTGNKISWDDFLPDSPNLPGPNILGGWLHKKGVPSWLVGMADGGTVSTGGAFLVGERGPEIAMLPRGSAVTPIGGSGSGNVDLANALPEYLHVKTVLNIDGREVGEATSKYRLDRKARK